MLVVMIESEVDQQRIAAARRIDHGSHPIKVGHVDRCEGWQAFTAAEAWGRRHLHILDRSSVLHLAFQGWSGDNGLPFTSLPNAA
jgi:hypothetical protein